MSKSLQKFTDSLPEKDPLLQLIGSIQTNIPDLAEKHDDYIGQFLYQKLMKNK